MPSRPSRRSRRARDPILDKNRQNLSLGPRPRPPQSGGAPRMAHAERPGPCCWAHRSGNPPVCSRFFARSTLPRGVIHARNPVEYGCRSSPMPDQSRRRLDSRHGRADPSHVPMSCWSVRCAIPNGVARVRAAMTGLSCSPTLTRRRRCDDGRLATMGSTALTASCWWRGGPALVPASARTRTDYTPEPNISGRRYLRRTSRVSSGAARL